MMQSIETANSVLDGTAIKDVLGNYIQPGDTVYNGTRLYTVVKLDGKNVYMMQYGQKVEKFEDLRHEGTRYLLDLTAMEQPARLPREELAGALGIIDRRLSDEQKQDNQVVYLVMEKKSGDRILHAVTIPDVDKNDVAGVYSRIEAVIGRPTADSKAFWMLYPSNREAWYKKYVKKTQWTSQVPTHVYWTTAKECGQIFRSRNIGDMPLVDRTQYRKIEGRSAIVGFFKSEYGIDIGKGTTLFI